MFIKPGCHEQTNFSSYLNCKLFSFQEGSRIGLQRQYDGTLHVFVDSKYKGAVASDIPQVSVKLE